MYARLKDNIWAADLAEMRYLSSKNRTVKYSLRVTNVLTKYAQVKPLRDKKGGTITNGFLKIEKKLIVNQINSGLIKRENFTKKLCKNSQMLIILSYT